ncbi:MAG: 3'(2'),5'-bisphosphate nucleotidase [Gallionellales bacterium 35-53-114]|nr:MAG: 3'(2'),5'-bisphosphate nucleotidase [Gallionellales bacterium 35-53-114]OYZ63529.1 MAG: 3'(2'),5'-bisphosphate nucleotidase [Gallionellales bacterium 24-53-125]OZB10861.1 MAG: 3'(2'),5'-bisphosphate nucleotidase [Gallionellales bacterium 39-52-133]HQS58964.1 3'(2'),5'-bisphosphate nucleotidase CysQ [Gallionellaceae bacterium]HQS75651.1 3'(2'),5'-bisphosphate nucleotidase CysQ [Gallionellaceae bacterium]
MTNRVQSAAPSNAEMTLLLQQIVQLARSAGAAIMEIYRSEDFGETSKADNSPLTLADLAAHKIIVAGLGKLESAYPILSEEDANIPYSERRKWSSFWLVDPLDGTKEFLKRNGEFTVNIALVENGVPVLGVVYAPVLDVCYFAARGSGAFIQRDGKPVQSIKTKIHAAGQPIKVVASRSHSDERTTALLKRLGEHECISMGSSLKLCLVAEGAAHFYPRLGPTMEWDTAAAHAVVNEAGGMVCNVAEQALRYNKEDLHNPEFLVLDKTNSALLKMLRDDS